MYRKANPATQKVMVVTKKVPGWRSQVTILSSYQTTAQVVGYEPLTLNFAYLNVCASLLRAILAVSFSLEPLRQDTTVDKTVTLGTIQAIVCLMLRINRKSHLHFAPVSTLTGSASSFYHFWINIRIPSTFSDETLPQTKVLYWSSPK